MSKLDIRQFCVLAPAICIGSLLTMGVAVAEGPVAWWSFGSIAEDLVADLTSPSQAVMKAELHERIEQELEMMEPADREILVLRHFEQLSTAETAQVLGISKSGAAKSYVRAIKHLRSVM